MSNEKIDLNLKERMAIANAINYYIRHDTKIVNDSINEKYNWENNHLQSAYKKVEKTLK